MKIKGIRPSLTLSFGEGKTVKAFEIIVMDGPSSAAWFKCSMEEYEQWNDAFVHAEYRDKDLGKLLLLAAIYCADRVWDGFKQDSRGVSDSQTYVYASLIHNRLVELRGRQFFITGEGHRWWRKKTGKSLKKWYKPKVKFDDSE